MTSPDMAPTEDGVKPTAAELQKTSEAPPEGKTLTYTPKSEIDEWADNVDEVSQQIKDLLDGTITDFDAFDKSMNLKQRAKEIHQEEILAKRERLILYGNEGKGEGTNYKWWCRRCFVEYCIDLPDGNCTRCKQADKMLTQEARREELMGKLEDFKKDKVRHQFRKDKWLRWKKSQAMLKRSRNINYKAWEYWEPDTDSEEEGDPIVPKDNPEFRAMEADIKSRHKKQSERSQTAEKFRERGNQCMKEGDYIAAIENYDEGLEYRRDNKAIWTNKALAEIKVFRWHDAIASCNKVIEYAEIFEEGFTKSRDACFKAFMRRAAALRALQKWDEALEDLDDALKLFPKDKEARDLHKKTLEAITEAAVAAALQGGETAPAQEEKQTAKPEAEAPVAEPVPDGPVRVEIEESDEEEEEIPRGTHAESLARLSKPEFSRLVGRLKQAQAERVLFCTRKGGDAATYANKDQQKRDREGRKVVFKVEEVPEASGLDNLLKDAEKCCILWKKHQGYVVPIRSDVKRADMDPHDEAEAKEAWNFLRLVVPRVLEILLLLATQSDHHCELSAAAIRNVWPLVSSDEWRQSVLQLLMEWSQRSVSARSLAEFASRYPKPHFHMLVDAATKESKDNILPPNFEAIAKEATQKLERGEKGFDEALNHMMTGLTALSPAELAVSTLGNICSVGHTLPSFKEAISPYCDSIVAALARLLRPLDWRLCGRAAGAVANVLRCGDAFITGVQETCLEPLVTALREETSPGASSSSGDFLRQLGGKPGNSPYVSATVKLMGALQNFLVLRPSGLKRVQELGLLPIVVGLIEPAPAVVKAAAGDDEDPAVITHRALTLTSRLIREVPEALDLPLEASLLRHVAKLLEKEGKAASKGECSEILDLTLRILTALITKKDGTLDRLTEKLPRVQELPEGETITDGAAAVPFGKLAARLLKLAGALKAPDHVSPDEEGSSKSRIRGNLALLFARLVKDQGADDAPPVLREIDFEPSLPLFVEWLRKERGAVQQNVGVLLTGLAQSPKYRQKVRDINGMESLHQIMLPKVEADKAEASRLHRLKSMRGLV